MQPGAYNDGSLGILAQPGSYRDGTLGLGVFAQPGAYNSGTLGMLRTAPSVRPAVSPAARALAAAAARAAARAQCFGGCARLPGAQAAACMKGCGASHPLSADTSNLSSGGWAFALLALGVAGLSYVAITAS